MGGIGDRLREERERLALSQSAFGEIGGVKANAQGKYEKGERFPDAAYLAAVAASGADVLYVVTGERTPCPANSISGAELKVVSLFRKISEADRVACMRILIALASTVS